MSSKTKIDVWRAGNPGVRLTESILREVINVADLRGADLRGANLCDANLCGADLCVADLCGADLCGADLRGADLWGGMPIQAGKSGYGDLVPTPDGWQISIGCWKSKTLDDLRDLIADRADWPEASGEEREHRRPILRAVLALCEAHIGQQPADIIEKLAQKWRNTEMK